MSVLNFPDTFYMLPLESSGIRDLGGFTGASGELKHILLWMVVVGTSTGLEQFTLGIYPDNAFDDFETAIASSTARTITDFSVASNGYNYVRFDFSDVNINANISYRLGLSSTNYTRNGDVFYVGPLLDWPSPEEIYTETTAAKMVILTES